MKLLILMSGLLFITNNTVPDCTKKEPEKCLESNSSSTMVEHQLFNSVFGNPDETTLCIDDIVVFELEEELEYDFNTKDYLPVGFNPLKGKYDLDWRKIELVELEEELEYDFDTKNYLPVCFNSIKGKHDLDWSKIELVELEEELEYDFDTKDYLPVGFDTSKTITTKIVKVLIY